MTRNIDSGEVKVYVDGKLDAMAVSEQGEKTTPFNSFGRREQTGPGGVCLKCMLDEICIFKGILSAEEVRNQFESAK
jgi:hypothetical protein